MSKTNTQQQNHRQSPWNKGRLIGQKRPLKPKEVWNIRARLQIEAGKRDLAMFNLAIDSKLRGCDLVRLKIDDLCVGGRLRDRAAIIQKKTGRPVQFELTSSEFQQSTGGARAPMTPKNIRRHPKLSRSANSRQSDHLGARTVMIRAKAVGSTSDATTSRMPLGRTISTADGNPLVLGLSSTQTRTICGDSMGGCDRCTRRSRRQVNNCPGEIP